LKIGIMLRHYGQHGGGVYVYTHSLLKELLSLNDLHEFVLIYNDEKFVGTYQEWDGVREIAVTASNVFFWDQIAVRRIEKEEKFDLIFNPKYSIPLTAKCKTVYVSHGLNWAVLSLPKPWTDYFSHRFLRPRYAQKADAIIAVSNTTRENIVEYLRVSKNRVHTVYHGVDDIFLRPVTDTEQETVKLQFRLPERFFLFIGQIYPAKNIGRLLQAYAKIGPKLGIYLVIGGEHRWHCNNELELIDRLGISSWVIQLGWLERDKLPAIYKLAEALVLPSLYESFGMPLLEAMSVGCPVVTSNRYGTLEIAKDAGILVDPENIDSIANGLKKVANDIDIRTQVIRKGYKRASNFSWKKCAFETMKVLEKTANHNRAFH
jgi:glycosyltransferase involved in cell wall biosynthesis